MDSLRGLLLPGDSSEKVQECLADTCVAGVYTSGVLLRTGMPWCPVFHYVKSENSAGRIKIKELVRPSCMVHSLLVRLLPCCLVKH